MERDLGDRGSFELMSEDCWQRPVVLRSAKEEEESSFYRPGLVLDQLKAGVHGQNWAT